MVKHILDDFRSGVADDDLMFEKGELGIVQSKFGRGDADVRENGSLDVEEAGSVMTRSLISIPTSQSRRTAGDEPLMSDGVRLAVRAGDRSGGRLEAPKYLVRFDVSTSLEHQSGSLKVKRMLCDSQ